MDVAAAKGHRTAGAKAFSRTVKTPSPSASSWGLSGRVGVRVLMHRDMIARRFLRSLPRSWLNKYWARCGQNSPKSSSSPLRWSSSPFSLSSPRFSSRSSSLPSHFLRSPVSRLSFSALRDRDREKDQAGPGASQALDGHRGFPGAPGMTVGLLGPSSQLSAVQFSCSSSSSTCSLPQHANSGWAHFFCGHFELKKRLKTCVVESRCWWHSLFCEKEKCDPCVSPSDPCPGRWMKPMLSASNAAMKTSFLSLLQPQSPSLTKVKQKLLFSSSLLN